MSYRDQLKGLLRSKSLVRGKITLSSGAQSDYYLDCKLTTLDPFGAFLTGHSILDLLQEHQITAAALGGLSMGADPIVSAVAVVSHLKGTPIHGFLVRKEPKGHGRRKLIEGFEGKPNDKVVIIDEVCTTGGSILEAIDAAEAQGFEIVAVVSLVDREEGGSERLRATKYPYYSVFTAKELLQAEVPEGVE